MTRCVHPRDLIDRLDAFSRTAIWTALAVSCLALIVFDSAVPEVGTGPLYIPLIALAGWGLGPREACGVAFAAACLNILPLHGFDTEMSPVMATIRGTVRLGAYAFVTLAVCGLRRIYDRERYAARHDPLTGVLNRAAFETHARTALETQSPDGAVTVLVLADIDDFKSVNDTSGHEVGDDVLRRFAVVGASAIGQDERFGRLGGDEFVLLLQAGTVAAAVARIEVLHHHLRDGLRRSDHPVGVSMGALVIRPGATLDWKAVLREADRLMYLAKRAGKGGFTVGSLQGTATPVTSTERAIASDLVSA